MKIAGQFSCGRPMAVPTRGPKARREDEERTDCHGRKRPRNDTRFRMARRGTERTANGRPYKRDEGA